MNKIMLNELDLKREEMISFLEKLVNIDSGKDNPEGIRQIAETIGEKLDSLGFDVEYIDHPGICTDILAHKKGKDREGIMILGHMDTVFKIGTAEERPFTRKEDKAFGPGVLDMKSGIVISLFALEALIKSGWDEKDITVLFCGDEETGHANTNTEELIMKEAKGLRAVFNLETSTDEGAVVVGRKGVMNPEIKITGKTSHAGKDPENGASAIVELAYKIIDIKNLTNYEEGITFNVGVISGGTALNVVAGSASCMIDIRFANDDQKDKAIDDLNKIADKVYVEGTNTTITNTEVKMLPMETTDEGMKLFEIVKKQGIELGLPYEIKPIYVGGGSDACWTVKVGTPTVCGMGARGEYNHGEKEYIYLESLVERSAVLVNSIIDLGDKLR